MMRFGIFNENAIPAHRCLTPSSLFDVKTGQVLTHGKPSEVINNEDVKRVYLGDMFVNGR